MTSRLLFSFVLLAACQTHAEADTTRSLGPIRGMTISCQTWGHEWATPGFAKELDRLQALGINWVSIHPYARIHGNGHVASSLGTADADWIVNPIKEAHARGMKIMMKPHLAYWGSPFSWRGEIDFKDRDTRARFFTSYSDWIVKLAGMTRKADLFVVGTELDKLTQHDEAWRTLIDKVRAISPAQLTYAANWDAWARTPFWDALDAIGVQAYFPLSETPGLITRQAAENAWTRVLSPLKAASKKLGKPVIFAELGYDQALHAPNKPWRGARIGLRPNPEASRLQQTLYRAAFNAIGENASWLRGAFLWKWFVGPSPNEDFAADYPAMHDVLNSWGKFKRQDR